MAIVGNMISNNFVTSPGIIKYDMFVAVFSMLSLFYLVPATLKEEFHSRKYVVPALEFVNFIFFLSGGAATGRWLGTHTCDEVVSADSRTLTFFAYIL